MMKLIIFPVKFSIGSTPDFGQPHDAISIMMTVQILCTTQDPQAAPLLGAIHLSRVKLGIPAKMVRDLWSNMINICAGKWLGHPFKKYESQLG